MVNNTNKSLTRIKGEAFIFQIIFICYQTLEMRMVFAKWKFSPDFKPNS